MHKMPNNSIDHFFIETAWECQPLFGGKTVRSLRYQSLSGNDSFTKKPGYVLSLKGLQNLMQIKNSNSTHHIN